jgi:acyl-CoA hydrolase
MTLLQTNNIKKQHIFTFTVFPDYLNWSGTLFGGKLLAELDSAAANCARKILYGTSCNGLVTATLNKVDFKAPAHLGDIVEMHTAITAVGRSSITVTVVANKEQKDGTRLEICQASFVFVALKDGKPFPHNANINSVKFE